MSEKRYSLKKDDMYHKAGTVFSSKDGKTLVSDKGVFVLMRYVVDFDDWFEPLSSLSQETEECKHETDSGLPCIAHFADYSECIVCLKRWPSPHLDRKIEPLDRTDLEAEFGADGYLRGYLLNSDGVDKIKALFSVVNQLQEVRRP